MTQGEGLTHSLAEAAARLATISDTPRLDAELLMAHALGIERETMLLNARRLAVPGAFAGLIERRMAHEPVAYIIGYRDFWTVRIAVAPGALIPRPDSETLIDAAIAHFGDAGPATILDLGTGPGTLLIAALDSWPDARGTGVERSAAARVQAEGNVAANGMADRATIVAGDWHDAPQMRRVGLFDLILCNPPYVEDSADLAQQVRGHEPAEALFAGADGLDDYRIILPHIRAMLAHNGRAIIEIGYRQAEAVSMLAQAAGLTAQLHKDLAGRDRALCCAMAS